MSTFIIVEAQQTRFGFFSVLLPFLLVFVDLDSTRLKSVPVVVQYVCSRSGTSEGLTRVRRLFSPGPAGLLDLLFLLIVRLIPPPKIAPLSFLKHGDVVCNVSRIVYTDWFLDFCRAPKMITSPPFCLLRKRLCTSVNVWICWAAAGTRCCHLDERCRLEQFPCFVLFVLNHNIRSPSNSVKIQ